VVLSASITGTDTLLLPVIPRAPTIPTSARPFGAGDVEQGSLPMKIVLIPIAALALSAPVAGDAFAPRGFLWGGLNPSAYAPTGGSPVVAWSPRAPRHAPAFIGPAWTDMADAVRPRKARVAVVQRAHPA